MQVSDSHHHMFQFHLSTQCHAAGRLKALENVTMGDRTYSSVQSGLCFHWQIWHPFGNPARCTADGGVVIYMHNIYTQYKVFSLSSCILLSIKCVHALCMRVYVCVHVFVCVHACLGLSLCACAVWGMVGGRSMLIVIHVYNYKFGECHVGIAQWLERQTCGLTVMGLSRSKSGRRNFFSGVNILC